MDFAEPRILIEREEIHDERDFGQNLLNCSVI